MLARKGRYRAEDFAVLRLLAKPDLADLKRIWIEAIEEARRLVRTLPAVDAGCLYLDPDTRTFVTPSGNFSRLIRHHGTYGGILPAIGDQPMLSTDLEACRRLKERYDSESA
jgi:hypothetical protein